MAWARGGDTAPTHPVALRVLEHPEADDRIVNEVFGFIMRCAMASTAHNIEYRITKGTAGLMAGGHARAEKLLEIAQFAGYITRKDDAETEEYQLFQDDEFIHLIPWDQREWAKQQKRDRCNWPIVIPMRIRDGDGCRYCGRIVQWGNNKSALAGTYDHLYPGKKATFDTYVVSCRGCNAKFGDSPIEEKKDHLLPAPLEPYYTQYTVTWLTNHHWVKDNDVQVPKASKKKLSPGALVVQKETSARTHRAKADGPLGRQTDGFASAPASVKADGPLGRPSTKVASAPASARVNDTSSETATRPSEQPGERPGHTQENRASCANVDGHERAHSDSQKARSEGLSTTQVERDPAGANVRSEGLSTIQVERDPANGNHSGPRDTADAKTVQDPAEKSHGGPPKCATPAPLSGLSPGETLNRADSARNLPDSARFCSKGRPRLRADPGRDGSGRVDPGMEGPGRDGPGRVEPGRAGSGRARAPGGAGFGVPKRRRR